MKKVTPLRPAGDAPAADDVPATDRAALDELDQVRELLFGQRTRDQERQAEQLDGKFEERVATLRAHTDAELVRVADRAAEGEQALDAERRQRTEQDRALGDAADAIRRALETLTERLEAERKASDAAVAARGARIEERLGELQADIERRHAEMTDAMAGQRSEERARLARLLCSVASELTGDD